MTNIFSNKVSLVAAAFFGLATSNAFAQEAEPCYGNEVLAVEQGLKTNGQPVAADRSNPDVVLGEPALDNSAGSFFSLGVGGFIEIGFDGIVLDLPGNDLLVVETSFSGNNCGFGDDEFADIELSQDGINWEFYGTICRNEEIDIADTGLDFITAIRITNSAITTTPDGYDLDGVIALNGCEDFPVIEDECYGHSILSYEPGEGNIPANRMNPEQALGAPERTNTLNFVSLGFGGTLIIGLDEAGIALPGVDDLEVVETTFGNKTCQNYEERAAVYVSQQVVSDPSEVDHNLFHYVGESCTNGAFFDVYEETGLEYFTLVKLVDVTPEAAQFPNRDGYDVDGIVALNGCQEAPELIIVPEPGDCFATQALLYEPGLQADVISVDRTNPELALGEPDRGDNLNFVALGFGGVLVLGFDGVALALPDVNDLEVVETTFGTQTCDSYEERAEIYVSQQMVNDASEIDHDLFVYVGESCTNGDFFDVYEATGWNYFTLVKFVESTPESAQFSNRDGYDVDGIVALNNDCFETPDPDITEDPYCTNETVFAQEGGNGDIVRLTAMGFYQECTGEYGFRWRIRNETSEPASVVYTFAGNTGVESDPFFLEPGEAVFFTTGFGEAASGGGTMIIKDLEGNQLDVKAHGGSVKDLSECSDEPCNGQLPDFLPQSTASLTAYPNPSPGLVNVEFSTSKQQMITLEVVDLSGRVVAQLFRQNANDGQNYRVEFNGTALPNGVYITRMTTESDVIIEKVMIAR